MRQFAAIVLTCVGCVFLTDFAWAEFRIATVDINRVLNEAPEARQKKKQLDETSLEAKKKADAKRNELKNLETKLKEKKVSVESKEAESFRQQEKDYVRFVKDTEEDLKKQFLKLNKTVTEKALAQIEAYAKERQIDLVLDKSEKAKGPVLFGANAADITDAIIEKMND